MWWGDEAGVCGGEMRRQWFYSVRVVGAEV